VAGSYEHCNETSGSKIISIACFLSDHQLPKKGNLLLRLATSVDTYEKAEVNLHVVLYISMERCLNQHRNNFTVYLFRNTIFNFF
jgi:hypothetical protein